MDINEGTTTDDLWTPYKELVAVVEGYLATEGGGAPYAVHTFESVLRRHKQTFLALFKNPPKNLSSREDIKRGVTEGVILPSVGKTLLSKELIDEAIIISDMYNVSEYLALELLHTASRQLPRHPGLARGLVAVLLYYDGKRALVQALKDLFMAREGVCWSITAREEIVSYVSRYVSQLVSDGVLSACLDALQRFTMDAQLDLLQANRALPPHRHHLTLLSTIQNTRKMLAGVVFAAAAQRGLNRDILMRLIAEQTRSNPEGPLDEISLALQMALLYALDLSVLHRREDGEELAKKLPLIQDPELISVLLDTLSTSEGDNSSGPLALCQLSLGLALAALKRAPHSLLRNTKCELLDQDELLVDAAIDAKVFEYLDESILSTDLVANEEYYQRRIHTLITDFIVLMHSKLMEMRVKADEAARAVQMYAMEGLQAPRGAAAPRTRLAALLRCVERLYQRDPRALREDYWLACTATPHTTHRSGGRAATLYKFVRLSGEVVCGALLGAYLRALASLAVPKHTWALLARRDALSAHHLLTALARYHSNLRVDAAPFSDHAHSASLGASAIVTPAARPGKLLVRQEEVEAMIAALRLIAAVARQDAAACQAICENLQWDAVNCMFGLVCCHVPLQLKAELCSCLSALGSSSSTAPRVWAAMEAAQLVAGDKRALNADLQEVECRIEEYPLSRAFLTLLYTLCGSPLPRALGAGARAPGLEPYVTHVLYRLALPAVHRPYANTWEKWQVLSMCFRLFARWLDSYEPSPSDFPPLGRQADSNPPPGFQILMQLHTKSELLRLVLAVLDEAYELLNTHPLDGKTYVEQSLVSVLQMLERALSLERALLTAAASANRSVIIVPLSKLILDPEGPNNSCRLVTCCKLLQLSSRLPAAAARAVSLLQRALAVPGVGRHLLASATHTHVLANEIRYGFVECLEAEEWVEKPQSSEENGDTDGSTYIRQAKEGVVMLLLHVLPTAPHNLAHFLLGYQLSDDVSRSQLNEAGVGGYPRTCLHSIIDILEQHIVSDSNKQKESSNLVESCYKLLYWLCARHNTSAPVLRFLRSRDYFLSRHVKATVDLKSASTVSISGRSWLLRAAACEAGAAAASRHHAALTALITALTHTPHHPTQEWEWCLLRRTLEHLPVSVEAAVEPRWELFHAAQLRQAIESCDIPTGLGGKRISVSRLHALLTRELAALHATAPQRNLVANEIQKVLDYVTEVNCRRNLAATLTHYYDSWRQLTEILFCVAPQDLLSLESRKNLLLNILQDLLNKIPPGEVLPQLGNLASGTVLLLLVNLRHCYILQKRDTTLKSNDFELSFFGPTNQIMQTNSLTLKFILHKILSWILVSGGCTQKMRVNLYGALLNYLNIVNLKTSPAEPEENDNNSMYVSRLDSSKARPSREESALKAMVIDVISDFGENLCSIVCSDCIGAGQDVCRMVALACLDTLIEINPRTDWMNTLTNQGYLRSLIDSLLQDDEGLKEALEPNPKSLRVLYVYSSKVALLTQLSGSVGGAETVLAQGAVAALGALTALARHPDLHAPNDTHQAFVPPVAARFRQILIPALGVCSALLTTLGSQNHSCVLHVTHALLTHVETIDCVLRAAHPNSPPELLEEVEALTSVIARASTPEVLTGSGEGTALAGVAPAAARVRALMLALLHRFHRAAADVSPASDTDLVYYKIVYNTSRYVRTCVSCVRTPPSASSCSSLAALLQQLSRDQLHQHKLLATTTQQLHALPTSTLDDLKKLIPEDTTSITAAEVRARGRAVLSSRAALRRRATAACGAATASVLQLLWAHADLLLRQRTDSVSLNSSVSWRSGNDELVELRKELIAVFNDRFTEQLIDSAKNQSPTDKTFLEILVKDIKSMIQFSTLN